jgi:hypothetical protein
MPARANLSSESIKSALADAGGAVSVAARNLGVSTRTLHRRLKEMPHLRPAPHNPLWEKAIDNRHDIQNTADENLYSPNVRPFSKLWRQVEWNADQLLDAIPRKLDEHELEALLNDLRDSEIVRIEFDQFGRREFRPHLIDRKI